MPSRWKFITGHFAALIGIWWKFTEPSRLFCVSRLENSRPATADHS